MKNPFLAILYFSLITGVIFLGLFTIKNFKINSFSKEISQNKQKEIVYPSSKEIILTERELEDKLKENLPKDIRNAGITITPENIKINGEYVKIVPLKAEIIGKPEVKNNKLTFVISSAKVANVAISKSALAEITKKVNESLSQQLGNVPVINFRLETGKIIILTKE